MRALFSRLGNFFSSFFARKKTVRLGIYGEPNVGKTTLANKISMDWLGEPVGTVSEVPHETRTIQRKEHVKVQAGGKTLVMNLLDMPGLATKVDYRDFLRYSTVEEMPKSKMNILKTMNLSELRKIAKKKDLELPPKKRDAVSTLESLDKAEILRLAKELKINIRPNKKKRKIGKTEAKSRAKEATEGIIEAIKFLDNVDTVLVMMDSTKDPLTQVNIMLVGQLEAKRIPIIIVANKTDVKRSDIAAIEEAFPQHPVVPVSAKTGDNLDNLYLSIADHSK